MTHSLPLADFNTDTDVFIEGRPTERRDGRAHVWYSINPRPRPRAPPASRPPKRCAMSKEEVSS
jgi:hypothetical protein